MKNNIPQLRFPEFKDCGEWEEVEFAQVTSKKRWSFTGGPFGSNLKSSDYTTDGIRVIQLQNIGDAEFINEYKIFTSEEKANELLSCNIYPDDIIMSKMGDPVGRACLIPHFHNRYLMCSDGIRIHVDTEKYSNYFVYSFINSNTFRSIVNATATGSTRKRIGLDELKKLPFVSTVLPEQQKIANCLSSLDTLINAQSEKVENLKAHKKGLLQKLFPQEGQSVPEFRFPEFKDCGEWEEVKFSEYIKLSRGSSPRPISEYLTQNEDGVNWIKIGDTKHVKNYILNTVEEKISKEGSLKSRKVVSGELILANSMSYGKTYQLALDGCIYDGWFVLRDYENYYYKPFLLQLLNSEYMQEQYRKLSAGGIVQNISSEIVYETKLFDISLPEQQKIADCLSSLDEVIDKHSQKLELLKAHKKGLMQGLFP